MQLERWIVILSKLPNKQTGVKDKKTEGLKCQGQEVQKEEKKDMPKEGMNQGYQKINVKDE